MLKTINTPESEIDIYLGLQNNDVSYSNVIEVEVWGKSHQKK